MVVLPAATDICHIRGQDHDIVVVVPGDVRRHGMRSDCTMYPPPLAAFSFLMTMALISSRLPCAQVTTSRFPQKPIVMAIPTAQVHDVQAGFGLERVVCVHAALDEVLEDFG